MRQARRPQLPLLQLAPPPPSPILSTDCSVRGTFVLSLFGLRYANTTSKQDCGAVGCQLLVATVWSFHNTGWRVIPDLARMMRLTCCETTDWCLGMFQDGNFSISISRGALLGFVSAQATEKGWDDHRPTTEVEIGHTHKAREPFKSPQNDDELDVRCLRKVVLVKMHIDTNQTNHDQKAIVFESIEANRVGYVDQVADGVDDGLDSANSGTPSMKQIERVVGNSEQRNERVVAHSEEHGRDDHDFLYPNAKLDSRRYWRRGVEYAHFPWWPIGTTMSTHRVHQEKCKGLQRKASALSSLVSPLGATTMSATRPRVEGRCEYKEVIDGAVEIKSGDQIQRTGFVLTRLTAEPEKRSKWLLVTRRCQGDCGKHKGDKNSERGRLVVGNPNGQSAIDVFAKDGRAGNKRASRWQGVPSKKRV
ncbi:hypothetical protein KCU81_g706, partial [Aureobasidium melanogenum]